MKIISFFCRLDEHHKCQGRTELVVCQCECHMQAAFANGMSHPRFPTSISIKLEKELIAA